MFPTGLGIARVSTKAVGGRGGVCTMGRPRPRTPDIGRSFMQGLGGI
jgi:hypothetical protein